MLNGFARKISQLLLVHGKLANFTLPNFIPIMQFGVTVAGVTGRPELIIQE